MSTGNIMQKFKPKVKIPIHFHLCILGPLSSDCRLAVCLHVAGWRWSSAIFAMLNTFCAACAVGNRSWWCADEMHSVNSMALYRAWVATKNDRWAEVWSCWLMKVCTCGLSNDSIWLHKTLNQWTCNFLRLLHSQLVHTAWPQNDEGGWHPQI